MRLHEMLINTADDDGPHLIKMRLTLGLESRSSELSKEEIDKIHMDIRQAFVNKLYSQVSSDKQLESLKPELIAVVNESTDKIVVNNIYFNEFDVY